MSRITVPTTQDKIAALEAQIATLIAERDQFARLWNENQDLLAASKEVGFQFDEVKRLTAERDAAKAVRVKPLVWEGRGSNWSTSSPVSHYHVAKTNNPRNDRYMVTCIYLRADGNKVSDSCGFIDGLEAAKDAAQADYESRILAALEKPE
jgi:hypothetical protein